MEKKLGKIKTIVIVLVSALLAIVAFWGVYVKSNGIWTNKLSEYKLGMDLSGIRELHFVLDDSEEEKNVYVDEEGNYLGDVKESSTNDGVSVSMLDENGEEVSQEDTEALLNEEETTTENKSDYLTEKRVIKANPDENVNLENFIKAKKIIQKRLETIDLYEYNIRQNTATGEIIVELPDNENLSLEEALITTVGDISIVDYQTGMILLDKSHLKNARTVANAGESGYQAYIQLIFDKVGAEKLKEISQKYISYVDDLGEQKTDYVSVVFDGATLTSTYFGVEIDSGVLTIPYGESTTDYETYKNAAATTSYLVEAINNQLPLKYNLSSDNYINNSLISNKTMILKIAFMVCLLIVSICMIILYKGKAVKFIALGIGYTAILCLINRYMNVSITLNSIITFIAVVAINYWFYFIVLDNLKDNNNVKEVLKVSMKKLYLALVPVIIIAVIFTFMASAVIGSIGMMLFWGLSVQALLSLAILL